MPETLYLTVNLIDRFLAVRNVTRKRLQLVSASANTSSRLSTMGHVLPAGVLPLLLPASRPHQPLTQPARQSW
jgi:hypothetical protein